MAATQQQRAALYSTLADTMGEEAADTLMGELPPAGWEQMATKQDLAAVETSLTTALTEGLAQAAAERAALNVKITEGLSDMNNKLTEGLSDMSNKLTEGLSDMNNKLTEGLSDMNNRLTEGLGDLNNKLTEGLAQATEDRAKLFRNQAHHLFVIVSTIVAAAVSIWIALFSMVG